MLPEKSGNPGKVAAIGPVVGYQESQAGPPLSLSEAIDFGLQNSPRLRSALAAIDRAQGQEQAAFAPFLPYVDMLNRGIATASTLSPGAPGPTGGILIDSLGPYAAVQSELQLQWTLYDFGRTGGRYRQAEMRRLIAELMARRARETVAFDVAIAYIQALEAEAFRKIADETIRRTRAVLEDTRARKAAGVALKDDVLRVEVQLAEAEDARVRAEDAEISGLSRLNHAMGRDANLPVALSARPAGVSFTVSLADCLKLATARRAEIGAARDRVAAAQFGRQAAQGEFMPRVSVRGSLGYVDGRDIRNGWQEGAGIHLDVPIYHGGQRQGELRVAEADVRQAVAEAQGVLDEVTLQVTLGYRGVVSARSRADLARPAIDQAAEALRIVRERYRNGAATPTDVIESEAALTRAQQRYASATLEFLAALARLAYVTGDDPGNLCGLASNPRK